MVREAGLAAPSPGRKREMAAGEVALGDLAQLRGFGAAARLGEGAARVELAAEGRCARLGISPLSSTSARRRVGSGLGVAASSASV